MMNGRLKIRLTFAILGTGLAIIASNAGILQGQGHPARGMRIPPLPEGPITYSGVPVQQPQGGPGIRPTRTSTASGFTAEELRRFLTSTAPPAGLKHVPNVTITRVDCGLTAAQVGQTVKMSTGLAPDRQVCYVEYHGNFFVAAPPSVKAPRGSTLSLPNAFRVYDARTGNIMLSGVFR
jgi:hypothetical protein